MAGTVTITKDRLLNGIRKLTFAWTADSGAATVPDTELTADQYAFISGRNLFAAVTVPDGTTAPTAGYGITFSDANGLDLLGGVLSGRSATAAEREVPKAAPSVYGGVTVDNGPMTFALTGNAVNSAEGICILYFSE